MKTITVLFLLFLSAQTFAQINLVQNNSFENVSGTLECTIGPTASYPDWITHDQQDLENYWAELPPWTVPEMGFFSIGAGSSDHLCDGGNTGNNYGFGTNREYICAPLANSLISGHVYYVEFYIKAAGTLDNAGFIFSNERPKQSGYNKINIDKDPNFEIDNAIVFTFNNWTRVTGYYTPDDNYSWLTFGTFNKDHDFTQSVAIDDIKIIDWGDDICEYHKLLENWNFSGLQDVLFQAGSLLYAGNDVGAVTANGDVIVPDQSIVSFKAGDEVGLFDGFNALAGTEFHAYNAPCGSDCFPPVPVAGLSAEICDGSPLQLGGDAAYNTSYAWSSSPASGMDNLSSATISNPVFTPPATGIGTVTYSVTATNACGQANTNSVLVHYDSDPSSVVQLSLANIVLGDLPSFDVIIDAHVKSITVEVLDPSLGNVYFSSGYYEGIDFTCCSFPWSLVNSLSPCNDYKIRVTATNYCTGAIAVQLIDWPRNHNFALLAPLPNVVTPNNSFCVQFTGAATYTFHVFAPSGTPVFSASGTASPPEICIWSGECNQGPPNCSSGQATEGTYFYTLVMKDCNGQELLATSGFVELLNHSLRIKEPDDSPADSGAPGELLLYPNPARSAVTIVLPAGAENGTLQVFNVMGEIVFTKEQLTGSALSVDLGFLVPGIYFARLTTAGYVYRQQFIRDE